MRVHHIAIAVRSLDEALDFWRGALGLVPEKTEEVSSEGVKLAVVRAGGCRIELLEPMGSGSPVASFLDKRGGGLHHVSFEVADLEAAISKLRQCGVRFAGQAPRPGAGGARIAFVHPSAAGGVLVELVEARPARGGEIGPGAVVLVYLKDPQEKLWGILRKIEPSGVVFEGIELASFDDWLAQIERGDPDAVGPSTLFVPMGRIEKILLDRPSGPLPSLAERFSRRTGRSLEDVLSAPEETA
jgi:methylmalonyl-CoA/ethylmalonyl-CoA epimerase